VKAWIVRVTVRDDWTVIVDAGSKSAASRQAKRLVREYLADSGGVSDLTLEANVEGGDSQDKPSE